jgi:hypothetical protein
MQIPVPVCGEQILHKRFNAQPQSGCGGARSGYHFWLEYFVNPQRWFKACGM